MRVFGEILLATLAVTQAAAYLDEQNDAVVIEGLNPLTFFHYLDISKSYQLFLVKVR